MNISFSLSENFLSLYSSAFTMIEIKKGVLYIGYHENIITLEFLGQP